MATYKKNNFRPNRQKDRQTETDPVVEQNLETLQEESTTAEVFNTLDEKASKAEAWVQRNQKFIFGGILAVILIGVGYMLYQRLIVTPKENEASNEISYPLQSFRNALNTADTKVKDSLFTVAIKGANGRYGFADIIKNYSGTKAANIATYSAGMAYLQMGKYKEAVTHLDNFSSDDEILSALALGNIGDAFVQLKQDKDALEYYQKAFKKSENKYTAPIYLAKAAFVASSLKDYSKALEYFERVKKDYPNSEEARTVDIQISRIQTLKGE